MRSSVVSVSTYRLNNRASPKEDEEHEKLNGPVPFQFDIAMMVEQSRPVSELFLFWNWKGIICVIQWISTPDLRTTYFWTKDCPSPKGAQELAIARQPVGLGNTFTQSQLHSPSRCLMLTQQNCMFHHVCLIVASLVGPKSLRPASHPFSFRWMACARPARSKKAAKKAAMLLDLLSLLLPGCSGDDCRLDLTKKILYMFARKNYMALLFIRKSSPF